MTRLVQTTMVRKDIQLSAMRCDVCDAYVFAFCQVPELGRFFYGQMESFGFLGLRKT